MNLSEIPLNEENFKHFHNREYKPTWEGDCERFMERKDFDEYIAGWQMAEDAVLFDGVEVVYDSGDLEYQPNPEFPVEIEIEGYEIESEMDGDCLTIWHNDFVFTLPYEKSTLADFVAACKICGIEIKIKNQ